MTKIPLTEQECREYQKNGDAHFTFLHRLWLKSLIVDTPRNYKPTERYHIPTVVKLHRGYSRLKNPKKKEAWVDERLWSLTPVSVITALALRLLMFGGLVLAGAA